MTKQKVVHLIRYDMDKYIHARINWEKLDNWNTLYFQVSCWYITAKENTCFEVFPKISQIPHKIYIQRLGWFRRQNNKCCNLAQSFVGCSTLWSLIINIILQNIECYYVKINKNSLSNDANLTEVMRSHNDELFECTWQRVNLGQKSQEHLGELGAVRRLQCPATQHQLIVVIRAVSRLT